MTELERKVDVRLALRAYQKLAESGQRDGDARRLGDLTARSDVDGYTVSVSDGTVTARLMFHNRVAIDTPSAKALEVFVRRLESLVDG